MEGEAEEREQSLGVHEGVNRGDQAGGCVYDVQCPWLAAGAVLAESGCAVCAERTELEGLDVAAEESLLL